MPRFGWIDGKRVGGDEKTFLQRYTPRRARSRWSRDQPRVGGAADRDGSHASCGPRRGAPRAGGRALDAAYDSPANITVPDDLRAALDAEPRAAEEFSRLNSTNRYAVLYHVHDAKRPETRARRIELRRNAGPRGAATPDRRRRGACTNVSIVSASRGSR